MTDMVQVTTMAPPSLDLSDNGQASKKAKHRLRLKQQRQCPQLSICPFIQSLPCGSSRFTVLAAMGEDVEVINLTADVPDFGFNLSPIDTNTDSSPMTSSVGPSCISFSPRFMMIHDSFVGPEEVKRANEVWNCHYQETPSPSPHKVTFSEELDSIHVFEDDDESINCRIGTWHCDSARFKDKIHDLSNVLSPILCPQHRQSVYERLHSSPLPQVTNNVQSGSVYSSQSS